MRRQIKVGSIIKQIRGVSYKPSDVRVAGTENAVALLRANNIQEAGLNFEDLVYIDRSKVKDEQYLRAGDILICSSSGSKNLVGKAAYVPENLPVSFGAFCKVVRTQTVDSCYLGQYFQSPRYRREISEVSAGANINNIRNEHIDELTIPAHLKSEQMEIVQILTCVDKQIECTNQQLTKLDELVKSRFVEMFGDNVPTVKLGDVCRMINGDRGKNYPSGDDFVEKGVPFVNAGHLQNRKVNFCDMNYITEEKFDLLSQGKMQRGDILYCLRGSLGKHGLVDFERGAVASSLVILRCNQERILPKFLLYAIETPEIELQLKAANNGSSQPNLSAASVKAYDIKLPTVEQQIQFVAFVEQNDKSKLAVKQSLEKLETLKKSLMQQYFG